jgi:hypothetical protein
MGGGMPGMGMPGMGGGMPGMGGGMPGMGGEGGMPDMAGKVYYYYHYFSLLNGNFKILEANFGIGSDLVFTCSSFSIVLTSIFYYIMCAFDFHI